MLVGFTFTMDPFLTSIFSCSNLEPAHGSKYTRDLTVRKGQTRFNANLMDKKYKNEYICMWLPVPNSPVTDMLSPVTPGDWYMPRSTKVVKEDFPDALTRPLD